MMLPLYDRPRGARGIAPLIAASMGIGLGRALLSGIGTNQRKQRNKGFIEENYRLARQRLTGDQSHIRQGSAEDLNRRGLVGSGFASIKQAMGVADPGNVAHTLGEQQQADLEGEFVLENKDLEQQRQRAHTENRAGATNEMLGAVASGVSTGMSVYSGVQNLRSAPKNTIAGAMQIPGAFGIDPVDPLGGPGSTWNPASKKTINGVGQPNYEFNNG